MCALDLSINLETSMSMASTPKLHHKASLKMLSKVTFTPFSELAYGAIVPLGFVDLVEVAFVRSAAVAATLRRFGDISSGPYSGSVEIKEI